jgi:hypothetical protein
MKIEEAREQEKITETKPPLSHLEFDILYPNQHVGRVPAHNIKHPGMKAELCVGVATSPTTSEEAL